jgi:hypothetical protein
VLPSLPSLSRARSRAALPLLHASCPRALPAPRLDRALDRVRWPSGPRRLRWPSGDRLRAICAALRCAAELPCAVWHLGEGATPSHRERPPPPGATRSHQSPTILRVAEDPHPTSTPTPPHSPRSPLARRPRLHGLGVGRDPYLVRAAASWRSRSFILPCLRRPVSGLNYDWISRLSPEQVFPTLITRAPPSPPAPATSLRSAPIKHCKTRPKNQEPLYVVFPKRVLPGPGALPCPALPAPLLDARMLCCPRVPRVINARPDPTTLAHKLGS